jgi:hypothetical protein
MIMILNKYIKEVYKNKKPNLNKILSILPILQILIMLIK